MEKNQLPIRSEKTFKVPETYFEDLEARVLETVNPVFLDEDSKLTKKPFVVPENYFVNFEARLTETIKEKSVGQKVISLFHQESFYAIAGAAAVFVAIVTTLMFPPTEPANISNIEMLALENYIEEGMGNSNFDFLDLFETQEGTWEDANPVQFDQDAILEYLNENVEQTALIFNEN